MSDSRFGRRNLLKLGLGVGGAGILASTGLGWAVFHLRPTAAGWKVLSTEEAAFLHAVAEALFPPGNVLSVDVKALDVAKKIDLQLSHLFEREQRAARGVLSAIDWWPRLSFQSTGRFASLSVADRVAVIRAWEESSREERRAVPELLRLMVGIHVFGAPSTLAAMGHQFGCTPDLISGSKPTLGDDVDRHDPDVEQPQGGTP